MSSAMPIPSLKPGPSTKKSCTNNKILDITNSHFHRAVRCGFDNSLANLTLSDDV